MLLLAFDNDDMVLTLKGTDKSWPGLDAKTPKDAGKKEAGANVDPEEPRVAPAKWSRRCGIIIQRYKLNVLKFCFGINWFRAEKEQNRAKIQC